jgi:thioesterase domain-containing protein/acyl carrier protein
VAEVVVRAWEEGASRRLVAYVVPASQPAPSSSELRQVAQAHLPAYMVPSAMIFLERLPHTATGKIDRRALPPPDSARTAATSEAVAPRDSMEIRLVRIWEDLLSVQPIGVRDSFFELGGHSLLTVRLLAQIQAEFGVRLPLSTLFQGATIEHLATMLREQAVASTTSCLVPLQPRGARTPFYCVHAIGGTVFSYLELARHLGVDQPCYGLQAPGVAGEQEEYATVEELAAHYLQALRAVQPQGPYRLGGWSFGGIVAFEMAQQLARHGEQVESLAMLDSAPPRTGAASDVEEAEVLADFIWDLGRSMGLSPELEALQLPSGDADQLLAAVLERANALRLLPPATGADQIRQLFGVFKANTAAWLRYLPCIYPDHLTYISAAERSPDEDPTPDRGWGAYAAGGSEVLMVPGDHYSMLQEPHVRALAVGLRDHLDRYEGRARSTGPLDTAGVRYDEQVRPRRTSDDA